MVVYCLLNLSYLDFMLTALESLVPIPRKPLSRFSMVLYHMYLLIASCHGHEVLPFWHGRVVHPLFPDITDCTNCTPKENFAFTPSYSFNPLCSLSHVFREKTKIRCAVFLGIAVAVTEYPEIHYQTHSTQEVGKIPPQSEEEHLYTFSPCFCRSGG